MNKKKPVDRPPGIPPELALQLLQDIADGVKRLESQQPNVPLRCLEVVFHVHPNDQGWRTSPGKALDYLVNDVYYFEDFDIRLATSCQVRTM